jgi:hypothetical protein
VSGHDNIFNSDRAAFPGSLLRPPLFVFSVGDCGRSADAIRPHRLLHSRREIPENYAMRRPFAVPALTAAAVMLAAFTPNFALAQTLPEPPVGLKPLPPPPPPPVKPYDPVTITLPAVFNDASFIAFRKSLSDIAQHKDRAGLAKLIAAKGFFWLQDKDLADPSKPGIDNLAKAIDLDSKDGNGWETIAEAAGEPTAAEAPQVKGVFCAPAPPGFDSQAFAHLLQATGTESDITQWGFPTDNGLEVRAQAKSSAAVIDKMGLYFVRVLPDSAPPDTPGAPAFLHVALPNGKAGYVAATAIAPLATDQICYTKDASGWTIIGYIGGVQP